MKKQNYLLLISMLLNSPFSTANDNYISTYVVGGTDSVEDAWPWMVYVRAENNICAGTLIDERTILTAAHCLYDSDKIEISASDITVSIGVHDIRSNSTDSTITQTKIHSGYDLTTTVSSNDIALLRLTTSTENITTVDRASVTSTNTAVSFESETTLLGWGLTTLSEPDDEATGNLSNILQQVNLPLQTDTGCEANTVSIFDASTMICAGDDDGGEGACNGDSGGPLLLSSGEQVGIVSWGSGCASAGNPSVFTRLAVYDDWIENFLSGITIDDNLIFGNTDVGESEVQNLLINNNSELEVQLSFLLTGSSEFTFDDTTCQTIAGNSDCQLPITYLPTSDNESTATLKIESDIEDSTTVTASLSGNVSTSLSSSSGGGTLFFILTIPLLFLRQSFRNTKH